MEAASTRAFVVYILRFCLRRCVISLPLFGSTMISALGVLIYSSGDGKFYPPEQCHVLPILPTFTSGDPPQGITALSVSAYVSLLSPIVSTHLSVFQMHHFHHLVEDSLSYNFASHFQQGTWVERLVALRTFSLPILLDFPLVGHEEYSIGCRGMHVRL